MDYIIKQAPQKSKSAKICFTIIVALLLCILFICIRGMFFYDEAYENSRALVEENTNLKIQLRDMELQLEEATLMLDEAKRKNNELSAAAKATTEAAAMEEVTVSEPGEE